MTTGEYMVSKSPLPTGSAMAHFLALVQGSAMIETVFARFFNVVSESEQSLVVSTKQKALIAETIPGTDEAIGDTKKVFIKLDEPSLFCRSSEESIVVLTRVDQEFVSSGKSQYPTQIEIK